MKTRLSMCAALALGLPAVALGVGRLNRIRLALLDRASHEAGRENVVTATMLNAIYIIA